MNWTTLPGMVKSSKIGCAFVDYGSSNELSSRCICRLYVVHNAIVRILALA